MKNCLLKISEYEGEENRLSRKIAELQNENERLKSFSGNSSEDTEKEIDHLKTLITQLVDSQFDEGYIKTQDARINEMTASISEHRKVRAEKEASFTLTGTGGIRGKTVYCRHQTENYKHNG